jgi:DNA-binding GntR family transcriptional regulator
MHAEVRSLADVVVQDLRTRILDGRLRLGESLSENALAAELGISKTPVREALLRLRIEGLVDVLPQRGTYVFRLGADQVGMISELREVLEVAAATAAMKHHRAQLAARMSKIVREMRKAYEAGDRVAYATLDGQFHGSILDVCGNTYMRDAYDPVGFRMQALRARLTDKDTLNRQSLQDHCEMLRLVKAGQTAALLRLIREHIRMTAQSSLELLANNLLLRGDRSRNRSGKIQRDPRRTAGGKRLNHTHSETEDRDSRSNGQRKHPKVNAGEAWRVE